MKAGIVYEKDKYCETSRSAFHKTRFTILAYCACRKCFLKAINKIAKTLSLMPRTLSIKIATMWQTFIDADHTLIAVVDDFLRADPTP